MADTIRQVDYHYVEVADKPGTGFKILSALKQEGVNLLAYCAVPISNGKAKIDFVPEDPAAFRKAAAKFHLKLSDREQAFLFQGEDQVGALADIFSKLANQGINITACQAVSSGVGRWAMFLWVKPADFQRASQALGV